MDEIRTLGDRMAGRLRFPEDSGGKKLLSGAVFRSPVGTGKIISLELPPPPAGLVSVVASEIPGEGKIRFGNGEMPVLAGNEILWHGQPLLVAAGPDPGNLEDWLSGIVLNVGPLEDEPTDRVTKLSRQKGSPGKAFSKAFQVIEDAISIPEGSGPGHPETVLCLKDGSNYLIHAATSWPGAVRRSVAAVLGIEKSNVGVRLYEVDRGSNREIWYPALSSCHAALLANRAKRSVRITTSIESSVLHGPGFPGADFQIRGAVDGHGQILALEADFTIHAGAIFPLEEEFIDRVILGIFSVYHCSNYIISGRIIYGDRTPSTFGPAAGFELGFLAGELFASHVAENSLTPPGGWRRGSLPVSGGTFGPGITLPREFPLPEMLGKIMAASDFERKWASFEQTRLGRSNLTIKPEFYRGIGLSCAWFGNGFLVNSKDLGAAFLKLTMELDGSLTIDIPSASSGAPLQRTWIKTAASLLGIEDRSIRFSGDSSEKLLEQGPTILGQDVSVYSRLLDQALDELMKKRFRNPLPITVNKARRLSGKSSWDSGNLEGTPFETISWGVGIVEVAVDTGTMEVRPLQVWMFIDGGTVLTPDYARSSVESSVEGALNWCLKRSGDTGLPFVDIQFHPSGIKHGPKDVATLPWLLMPAALVQAVRQASGAGISRIPITPEQLGKGVS